MLRVKNQLKYRFESRLDRPLLLPQLVFHYLRKSRRPTRAPGFTDINTIGQPVESTGHFRYVLLYSHWLSMSWPLRRVRYDLFDDV